MFKRRLFQIQTRENAKIEEEKKVDVCVLLRELKDCVCVC